MPTRGTVPLSPISFLERAADVYPAKTAIVTASGRSESYNEMRHGARQLAYRLREVAGGSGPQTIAVLARNGPELLRMHFGIPGSGASILALNSRLSVEEYSYMLRDAGAQILFVDPGLKSRVAELLNDPPCPIIDLPDPETGAMASGAVHPYHHWLGADESDPPRLTLPDSEHSPIAVNYTSGTTGKPKGAVYTHRGAYLNSMGVALELGFRPESSYLWTLPMFHCNGWCCTWAVTALGATHVTLADFDAEVALRLMARHGVSHLCGAPIVASAIAEAGASAGEELVHTVKLATGGSPPSPTTIAQLRTFGVEAIHLYGLTETYGPSIICEPQEEWASLDGHQVASLISRQGVRTLNVESIMVVDDDFQPVSDDGQSLGEIVIRSNTVVPYYLNEPEEAGTYDDEWLRTGDLAVVHPDGYLEIRDRRKDIIISGGENVSSIEVENVLASHPQVLDSAVVAAPHRVWGEVPVAFVRVHEDAEVTQDELIEYVRDRLAHFKAPKRVVFASLPKTSTGKVQKHLLRNEAQTFEL